ncbi:helix-turn-helix domain-containing protein [Chryseobacterium camelliae]|uniref:Helix-turn-helix domain-containing protein n=1 Tax=Chryseobacterium camelliae TaxID=1265445 RepID=A0ABY7QNN3_9FLAO|nr:helix-turn-helix domain-containing protein [Chryseobacterium camelliae]WBV61250.1 helix-turn-helix domain-containing protein [Chryseobacterium camelliae]
MIEYSHQKSDSFFSVLLIETHNNEEQSFYEMILKLPGQQYPDIKATENMKISQMQISLEIFEIFKFYLMIPPSFFTVHQYFKLNIYTYSKLLDEAYNINIQVSKNNDFWKSIYSRLKIIFLMINKEVRPLFYSEYIVNKTSTATIIQFIELIITHYKEERAVKYYADKLLVSPNYLNILANKYFSKNAAAIINNEVLLELSSCLAISAKSIKEIAYDFNFKNLSTFSIFFKKNTGITPREFINIYKK